MILDLYHGNLRWQLTVTLNEIFGLENYSANE